MVAESSDRFVRKIEREPVGVVFVIAPWNYPYLTACNTIIPALIAGNAVVHKSASQTLIVGERWQEAFDGVLPPGVFQNVVLDHEGTEGLLRARAFGFVNFTGSVNGGRAIERAAAGTFTPLGLELGGKDPGYVMEDADLDWAVDVLMDGAMFNAGQCCCGIERIYVHRSLYDGFVDRAVAWTRQLRLGNPLDAATTLGPMANVRFAREVRAQVEEAIAAGARPLVDKANFPADDGGAYLAPQILTNVNHSMRVMTEETFGPVVGVMPVDSDDDALALMNDSPYGLTASLWTSDPERALSLGERIETGTVFLNRADYLDPAVCWTGVKDTGRGAALSSLGYHSVTRPKSYHFRKVKP
jgi:acyl-CoA reductase-like NAD-dependent aldehyde dehydrogenase